MQNVDAIIVLEFQRDTEQAYTKVWKGLGEVVLEQRATLPAAVLAEGSLLELELDSEARELRVEYLRWEHKRQTLHVHVALTEPEAAKLRAQGFRAWRFWLRRRASASFLERCRQSGWILRGVAGVQTAAAPAASERIEPTL